MMSLEPGRYTELRSRLERHQAARASAQAALKALPPTRPQGAVRLSLPDEGDGLRGWSEAEAAEVARG